MLTIELDHMPKCLFVQISIPRSSNINLSNAIPTLSDYLFRTTINAITMNSPKIQEAEKCGTISHMSHKLFLKIIGYCTKSAKYKYHQHNLAY